MTELANPTARSLATDIQAPHVRITTDASMGRSDAWQGVRLLRLLVRINLGLVALQAISAGLFLSGYGLGVTVHSAGAFALQLGALIQAITAIVLWRRGRVPAHMAVFSIGLLAIVFLQSGFGYRKLFWLHVPIGVGLFGGLTRQQNKLETPRGTTGRRK